MQIVVSIENVFARLDLGYYVMIPKSDIRRDLEIILLIKDNLDLFYA